MGVVFKISKRGKFAYYETIRGSVILYVAFCCNRLSLYFVYKIRISKQMLQRAPSPCMSEFTVSV